MLLHTHRIEDPDNEGELMDVHALHISPAEAAAIVEVISNSILSNPESESYTLTLGRVEPTEHRFEEPNLIVEYGTGDE